MNWPRTSATFSLLIFTLVATSACGVKGDPLPPEKPVDLGRGRPTYRKATEGIKIEQNRRSIHDEDEEENKNEVD